MIDVIEVEFDELDCSYNNEAVCPYCSHENVIILDGEDDGDENETECANCEKIFMYRVRVSVEFDSQPVENYYLKERQRLQ